MPEAFSITLVFGSDNQFCTQYFILFVKYWHLVLKMTLVLLSIQYCWVNEVVLIGIHTQNWCFSSLSGVLKHSFVLWICWMEWALYFYQWILFDGVEWDLYICASIPLFYWGYFLFMYQWKYFRGSSLSLSKNLIQCLFCLWIPFKLYNNINQFPLTADGCIAKLSDLIHTYICTFYMFNSIAC